MKSPSPLRNYLLLKFGVVAFLPFIIAAGLIWQYRIPRVKTDIAVQLMSTARAVSGQISAHLSGGERQLISVANYLSSASLQAPDQTTVLLDALCGKGELFETIYITCPQNRVIHHVGLAQSSRAKRHDLTGLDLSGMPFIFPEHDAHEPAWSGTFLSTASGRLAVALCVPFGKHLAIGEITLDRMSELIRHLPGESGLTAMVLDRNGRIIADSEQQYQGQQIDLRVQPLGDSGTSGPYGLVSFEFNGKGMTGTHVKIPALDWTVLMAQTQQRAYETLKTTLMAIGMGLGSALILAVAGAWLQTGSLTRHIRAYTRVAQAIARGKYDTEIPASKTLELSVMGDNLKQMAEMIQQREKALQLTQFSFDKAAIGIYHIAPDARIVNANEQAIDMLGYSKDDLSKMTVMDIAPDADKKTFSFFWQALCRKGYEHFEATHRHRNGTDIPVEVISNLIEYDGEPLSVSFVRDTTDRKKAERKRKELEAQLWQTQKMEAIGTLAGGIAHDFNNILSGILGYAQLALMNTQNTKKAKRHVEQIIKGAQRASDLTKQVLTFSRQSEYEKRPFKIYLEIKEALKLLRSSIPSTIDITSRLDSKEMVLADPIKIHQVVMNLCTNAYHSMRDTGGYLTVSLTDATISDPYHFKGKQVAPGAYLKLEVSDTGHGMDAKTLEKAFEPYFTTKEKGDGTGLGLALVQAIVEEHDGFLEVTSRPGKGTHFYLYFPIVRESREEADGKIDKTLQLKGNEALMIIDDEAPIRESCKEFLASYGYRVQTFGNGMDALETFKDDPDAWDLVITDMTMPGLTGDKLAAQMLKIKQGIPIFLCTGFTDSISRAESLERGISQFLRKPVLNQVLAQLVRSALNEKAGTTAAGKESRGE